MVISLDLLVSRHLLWWGRVLPSSSSSNMDALVLHPIVSPMVTGSTKNSTGWRRVAPRRCWSIRAACQTLAYCSTANTYIIPQDFFCRRPTANTCTPCIRTQYRCLSKDFCLQSGLERKFLLRRTWSGQKAVPTAVSRTCTPLVRQTRFPSWGFTSPGVGVESGSWYIYIYILPYMPPPSNFGRKNGTFNPFPIPMCLHRDWSGQVLLRFQSEGKLTPASMNYAIWGQKLQANKNIGSNLVWGWKCQIQSVV